MVGIRASQSRCVSAFRFLPTINHPLLKARKSPLPPKAPGSGPVHFLAVAPGSSKAKPEKSKAYSTCSERCPHRLGPSRRPVLWCWWCEPERAGEQLQKGPVCHGSAFRLPAGEQRAFQECGLGSFSFHLLHEPPHWAWRRTRKAAFLSNSSCCTCCSFSCKYSLYPRGNGLRAGYS